MESAFSTSMLTRVSKKFALIPSRSRNAESDEHVRVNYILYVFVAVAVESFRHSFDFNFQ